MTGYRYGPGMSGTRATPAGDLKHDWLKESDVSMKHFGDVNSVN